MNKQSLKIICHFDGCCEPCNPGGIMGYGVDIRNSDGKILLQHCSYDKAEKENTNNIAEYTAFYICIKWLIENNFNQNEILIMGDSKLVIMQMTGLWKIKQGNYVNDAIFCKEKLKNFKNIKLKWISREQNTIADKLSKKHLENVTDWSKLKKN